jgi:hypothetical protein
VDSLTPALALAVKTSEELGVTGDPTHYFGILGNLGKQKTANLQ